jgi:RNA polymerase sigma-70 factor, ECF subfamily
MRCAEVTNPRPRTSSISIASLRRVARFYISDRAVADEVVQDTWLGVIQGIWAFEGRASLKTWIVRILINRAKARAGREGRTVPFARFDGDVDVAEATVAPDRFRPAADPTEPGHWAHPPRDLAASPEHCLLAREVREQLQSAIAALPEHQRLVLILRHIEGRSTEEVCNGWGFRRPMHGGCCTGPEPRSAWRSSHISKERSPDRGGSRARRLLRRRALLRFVDIAAQVAETRVRSPDRGRLCDPGLVRHLVRIYPNKRSGRPDGRYPTKDVAGVAGDCHSADG